MQSPRPPVRRSDESVLWRIGRTRPVASLPLQIALEQGRERSGGS